MRTASRPRVRRREHAHRANSRAASSVSLDRFDAATEVRSLTGEEIGRRRASREQRAPTASGRNAAGPDIEQQRVARAHGGRLEVAVLRR
jgi:hypothetical protein